MGPGLAQEDSTGAHTKERGANRGQDSQNAFRVTVASVQSSREPLLIDPIGQAVSGCQISRAKGGYGHPSQQTPVAQENRHDEARLHSAAQVDHRQGCTQPSQPDATENAGVA